MLRAVNFYVYCTLYMFELSGMNISPYPTLPTRYKCSHSKSIVVMALCCNNFDRAKLHPICAPSLYVSEKSMEMIFYQSLTLVVEKTIIGDASSRDLQLAMIVDRGMKNQILAI